MIKAEDIRKINSKEYKYLTKDKDGRVYAWDSKPEKDNDDWMFYKPDIRVYFLGYDIEVEEFQGKDWKECIISFVKEDEKTFFEVVQELYSDILKAKCLGIDFENKPIFNSISEFVFKTKGKYKLYLHGEKKNYTVTIEEE